MRRIRFQADNDLRKAIVRGAIRREPSLDFRSAQEARLDGIDDVSVLGMSAEAGRILVSHDFNSMPEHFRKFTNQRRSPGVLLVAQDLRVGEAIDSLLAIWEASEPEEWENRLSLVPSLVTIVLGRTDK